jgi:hypothetical protein
MPVNATSILPTWKQGDPIARVPLFRFCQIVRNILETATGIDRGTGAGSADGRNWHFGPRPGSAGSSGGIPEGYAEGTVITQIRYSSGYIQIKTATALIKDETADWSNAIEVATYSD